MARRSLLAFVVVVLSFPASASASGFCENGVVNDYSTPFESMPPLRPFPSSNDLPFGPSRLWIAKTHHPTVLTGETNLGLQLEYGAGAGGPTRRLDWVVVGRLGRLSRDGARHVLEKKIRRIARMQPGNRIEFRFPISAEPSLYRLELDFQRGSGKRFGRFGEYLRVVRPNPDLRLGLSGVLFHPGETVSTCIENYGTQELSFGACDPGFERLEGGVWTRFPPEPRPCIAIAYILGAGMAKPGSTLAIPPDAPAGSYRAALYGAMAEFQVLQPG